MGAGPSGVRGHDSTNQALIVHGWKNVSRNLGGNHGDIATATTPAFAAPVCS